MLKNFQKLLLKIFYLISFTGKCSDSKMFKVERIKVIVQELKYEITIELINLKLNMKSEMIKTG